MKPRYAFIATRRFPTLAAVGMAVSLLCVATLHGQSASTDFYGRVVDKNALCAEASGFMSEQDVERLISDMLAMQGLKNRFIVVGCQSVSNCIATVDKDKRPIILFNPAFLQRVRKLQFSASDLPDIGERDWTTLTILAHELGHHMNNHLTNPLPDATARDKELEADETAGFLLYLMGGQLEQGKLAFREASETGSYTHPPRAQRHQALAKGYRDAEKRFPRNRGGGSTDPKPEPRPDPVPPKPVSANTVNYASVTIGGQVWMAKNLEVDRFRNGDPIPQARTTAEWVRAFETKKPAWCYYGNDPSSGALYGKLYNWHAVADPRGLAPEGWHVPSDAEWTQLTDALGGIRISGDKLKSGTGWKASDKGSGNGSNASGFAGHPGGYRNTGGTFVLRGESGYWWSASSYDSGDAWFRYLQNKSDEMNVYINYKGLGLSVRCIRD